MAALAGCAGRLPQVPANQPHGLVELRVTHAVSRAAHEVAVVLDDHSSTSLRGDARVRLSPGQHQLTFTSTLTEYAVELTQTTNPYGQCVGPTCQVMIPTTEVGQQMKPQGQRSCSQTLPLSVEPGSRQLALLVARADGTCTACVLPDLAARSCP